MKTFSHPSQIKVGTIGYGGAYNMGRQHLREAARAGMTPTAVAEINPERRAVAASEFPGIHTFATVQEMLAASEVDLLAIITPHNTHAALALQCIEAGRGVICEKPFAVTTDECDAMIAAAQQHGVLLSTYHNRHWDGCIMKALEVVRAGEIGEIVRIEAHMGHWSNPGETWRASRGISGGILYDWGVHLLEYTLQLITAEITEVSGYFKHGFWAPQTSWKDDTVEDDGFATVRFGSGQWATVSITHLTGEPRPGWVTITGTKGSHIFEGRTWKTITHDGPIRLIREGNNPEGEGWRFYQNIADHLVQAEPLVITAEWARRPIHVIDLAGESARRGTSVPARYH